MKISLIQVPWDSGYYDKRMGKGPIHLIDQGLVDYLEAGGNTIQLNTINLKDGFYVEAGTARDLNVSLAKTAKRVRKESYFPVIMAGNCNTAIGTIAGL